MILLSVDPGVEKVGYAIFDKSDEGEKSFKYLLSGVIKTDRGQHLPKRLLHIYMRFKSIIQRYRPTLMVIERIFFFKNQKTMVSVSQAQGVIILLAAQKNLKVEYLTPLQIKQIVTGYGKADKKSVQKMISYQLKNIEAIQEDDQSDAIACGLAYCFINEQIN